MQGRKRDVVYAVRAEEFWRRELGQAVQFNSAREAENKRRYSWVDKKAWAPEAEESLLLEDVARERLVNT
jgi:hypothetical protein